MNTARNWPEEISSEQAAYVWMLSLMVEDGINFHPDDSAEAYVDAAGWRLGTFTAEEVEQFDDLRAACFGICDDVYATSLRAFETYNSAQPFRAIGIEVVLEWEETKTPVATASDAPSAAELALTLNRATLNNALRAARQEVARG